MKFLKTFFGQVLRKSDADFDQQGSRDGAVLTHIDYSDSLGGVINIPGSRRGFEGLNVYPSFDSKSIYITPGIFYNRGSFSETNSIGGGERGQIFTQQTFNNLPATPPLGPDQPSYIVVYIKTISVNYNPSPLQSQNIVTSRDVITGSNIPTREYTVGYIVISDPIAYSQIKDIGGVPLALLQVDSSGKITSFDTSVRHGYLVGGSVDLMIDKIVDVSVGDGFFTQRMISDGAIVDIIFSNSIVKSSEIAQWDGATILATEGSGVTTEHLKNQAITLSKISITGSMNNFSNINYISNGSFESSPTTLPSWSIFNPSGAATPTPVSTEKYYGAQAARVQGIILGQNPPTSQPVAIYQDVSFSGNSINNRYIGAFFYLKTDAAIPMPELSNGVSGTTGLSGLIEFKSNGITQGQPEVFASYTGAATGWTKVQSTGIIFYTGTSQIDSIRLSISGSIGNVSAYVDGVFLGTTNLLPEWTPNAGDFSLGDTLSIQNVNVGNLITANSMTSNSITGNNYIAGSIIPASPGVTTLGNPSGSFGAISTNDMVISGLPLRFGSNSQIFTNNGLFVVPPHTFSVLALLIGGGGGGSAGADEYYWDVFGWGGAGGNGGWTVYSKIAVTPGDVLNIVVASGAAGGYAEPGYPMYNDSFRTTTNGGITYDNGSRGAIGFDTKILNSNMHPIVVASGGMGGWGPWGYQAYHWSEMGRGFGQPGGAPAIYKGAPWYTSGNSTIYIQGTYGSPGHGAYPDFIGGFNDVSYYGGNPGGGGGGKIGISEIPSIGGPVNDYIIAQSVNALSFVWPQVARPNGGNGKGYGAGGAGGVGGWGTVSAGQGGYGGYGSQGLAIIYW